MTFKEVITWFQDVFQTIKIGWLYKRVLYLALPFFDRLTKILFVILVFVRRSNYLLIPRTKLDHQLGHLGKYKVIKIRTCK